MRLYRHGHLRPGQAGQRARLRAQRMALSHRWPGLGAGCWPAPRSGRGEPGWPAGFTPLDARAWRHWPGGGALRGGKMSLLGVTRIAGPRLTRTGTARWADADWKPRERAAALALPPLLLGLGLGAGRERAAIAGPVAVRRAVVVLARRRPPRHRASLASLPGGVARMVVLRGLPRAGRRESRYGAVPRGSRRARRVPAPHPGDRRWRQSPHQEPEGPDRPRGLLHRRAAARPCAAAAGPSARRPGAARRRALRARARLPLPGARGPHRHRRPAADGRASASPPGWARPPSGCAAGSARY